MEDQVAASLKKRGCGFYAAVAALVLLLLVLMTAAVTAWWYKRNFHAKPFTPVELSAPEQKVLDEKIEVLEPGTLSSRPAGGSIEDGGIRSVEPSPEEEVRLEAASRERRTLSITEKEINAILHHRTNLAERIKIRFYDGGIGAEANIPMEDDVPFFGGKTLRGKVAVSAYMQPEGGVAIIVKDVTVGGVPLPNQWLGGLKGTNLVDQYHGEHPFLGAIAAGIEEIDVRRGELRIRLKE